MGFYNVIRPCVVGTVQYRRPTPEFQPVELDDTLAAAAVAEGALTPYQPGKAADTALDGKTGTALDGVTTIVDPEPVVEPVEPEPKPRARSRPKHDVDEG